MERELILEIIDSYLDGTASPEDIAKLAAWLAEKPENAREFARIGLMHRGLFEHFTIGSDLMETYGHDQSMTETMILPAIRPDDESTPEPRPSVELFSLSTPYLWKGRQAAADRGAASKSSDQNLRLLRQLGWVAASIILVLALVGILMRKAPNNATGPVRLYGRIVATVNPQWTRPLPKSFQNGVILPRRPLFLTHGLVQIQMANGVMMVFQAPAKFRFRSGSGLDLSDGKVALAVPHTAIGFSVYTPHSVITDLGTKFGVMVQPKGTTTSVAVFAGRVAAESLTHKGKSIRVKNPQVIVQGQSAILSSKGIRVHKSGKMRLSFVRSLLKHSLTLSLVDLMTGGNGLGIGRRIDIDPLTGSAGRFAPITARPGNGIYHPVTGIPVVDGCFVPGSSHGPDQIDSAGQRFKFPTSGNSTFGNISAGGKIPWANTPPSLPIKLSLRGVNYAHYPHRLIVIHSNSGLTLNLKALRTLYPKIPIASFQCMVGDGFVGTDKYAGITNPKADIFVLVDGKLVFKKIDLTGLSRPLHLNIPLPLHAHFLTLVTTGGGDGYTDDWVLWCDPRFTLIPNIH